ncbi:MAG TPA: O-antigen ligase family protein [Gemmataceae bacterium]|nr:O-antigen ligase family protein [Gemmataceae bacterium]
MDGPEALRRGLLALVTALIVARPLVLGEDPGLLAPLSEPSGMVLTLLWLLAAVGWGVWRLWRRQPTWEICLVEVGLLGVVVLMFVSAAAAASYKHPAWLIAWEWLAMLAAFCLVRQLVVAPAEQHGLLAAVLATGLSLAAYGVYQYYVELPRQRAEYLSGEDIFARVRPEFAATVGFVPGVPSPAGVPWTALVLSSRDEPLLPVPPLEPLRHRLARQGLILEPDDPQLESWAERIKMNHAYSRFAHPNSFAGFLALLLPAMGGCTYAAWRGTPGRSAATSRPGHLVTLSLLCGGTALMGLALWLTHSRGAILGLLAAGGVAAVLYQRRLLLRHKGWVAAVLAGLLGLAALGYLVLSDWGSAPLGKESGTARARLAYWATTWRMICDHPWLGVGPGNLGRFYPRYMQPAEAEHIKDPHNFALEVWAAAGVFALLALLVALGAFFGRIGLVLRNPEEVEPNQPADAGRSPEPNRPADAGRSPELNRPAHAGRSPEPATPPASPGPPRLYWEFYFGGAVGLLLGFLFWALDQPPDKILIEGVTAAVLAAIWFGSYALLERIDWQGPARAITLAAGVAALLLNLTVSGGISFPSVAVPLWVMAALALNALQKPAAIGTGRHWLAWVIPLPLTAALGLVYYTQFFSPIMTAHGLARTAAAHAQLVWGNPDPTGEIAVPRPGGFFVKEVLGPLEQAVREQDPGNAQLGLEAARWYAEAWKHYPHNLEAMQLAIAHAARVHGSIADRQKFPGIDPEGQEGYLVGYRLQKMYADWLAAQSPDEKQRLNWAAAVYRHYRNAADLLGEAVRRDPTQARLRYQLAEVLLLVEKAARELHPLAVTARKEKEAAGDKRGVQEMEALARESARDREHAQQEARRQAQEGLNLDAQAPTKSRKLTDRQREQVRRWLAGGSAS